MTASTSLRQLSGLPAAPSRLSESALILVDAQNTYRTGVMQLSGVEPALDACASLLARARALKVPVIHIQHDAGPGTPYDIRAEIGAIADKVAPAEGEPVVVKNYPNSFLNTDLDARLKALGVKNLRGCEINLLRGPISRLRCSPYSCTAVLLGANSNRSRRFLHTL
jgi:hypothetical protein